MKDIAMRCSLLLDESVIQDQLVIDYGLKTVAGKVSEEFRDSENPNEKATHLLAFMIKGIAHPKKAVVAYYFTGNKVNPIHLKKVVQNIITYIEENTQLMIEVIINDMGPSNKALWNALGGSCTRDECVFTIPHPVREEDEINLLPDVTHLLKSLRNAFVEQDSGFKFSQAVQQRYKVGNLASVTVLDKLVASQSSSSRTFDRTLTPRSLHPSGFKKMRVKHAARVFSFRTAQDVRRMAQTKNFMDDELALSSTTAWLISTVAAFYERATDRKTALSAGHLLFENEFKPVFNDIIFVVEELSAPGGWKPWQSAIRLYCKSMINLIEKMTSSDQAVIPGLLTTDAIESFFSRIKARNAHPDASQVRYALKSVMISNLNPSSLSRNQTLDLASQFNTLISHSPEPPQEFAYNYTYIPDEDATHDVNFRHFVGEVVNKTHDKIKCNDCKAYFNYDDNRALALAALLEANFNDNVNELLSGKPQAITEFKNLFINYLNIDEFEEAMLVPLCHSFMSFFVDTFIDTRLIKQIQFVSGAVTSLFESLGAARFNMMNTS